MKPDTKVALFYAIAATIGIACMSAGYAVGKVGAAALGAAAEKPELIGRALIFVGLAEGIAIYGLIIGIMLLRQLG
jgi:V/A-type H+/Na+-transporting ATPase subunit K